MDRHWRGMWLIHSPKHRKDSLKAWLTPPHPPPTTPPLQDIRVINVNESGNVIIGAVAYLRLKVSENNQMDTEITQTVFIQTTDYCDI